MDLFLLMIPDIVTRAEKFAIIEHGNQKYGDEFPYIIHLRAVDGVLLRFGVNNLFIRTLGYLHDVIEDADNREEMTERVQLFFPEVVTDVLTITEPFGLPRKEKHEIAYPKIAQNVRALIVKFADRISHIEHGGKKVAMYRKEHSRFKAHLYNRFSDHELSPILRDMEAHVDGLLMAVGV
jgi:(p)ppGpp synthase/HD superfamily hydrolase